MARASYKMRPLSEQEQAAYDGFTHIAMLKATDIPAGLANAASTTFTLGPIPLGAAVLVEEDLTTPFQNTADATFNDSQIVVGDSGTANSLLTTTQLNLNGTEVLQKRGTLSAVYTAANSIIVTLASMTGKSSSNLNKGMVILLIKIINAARLASIKAGGVTA